ncbi:exonuclease domain-containing protein [Leuconostoc suionicum]|uniref:exonuclease domain-containing protein n=1 Tax=Leuconostoc suionicum TaxID=1511761 RepID=UPI001B8D42DF|nr:DNA polymerase III subunit epsilon [Leuconostoc suionicum]
MQKSIIFNDMQSVSTDNVIYDYIIFDIETTGLNKQNDDVIQLFALKIINDKVVDKINTFIKPKTNIPEKITYLTGIKNEDVYNAPSIDETINKFSLFIEGLPLIGHNIINFDLPFLSEKGLVLNGNNIIDTVPLSTIKLPNLKNHRLPTLKKYFGIDNLSHNALNDCETNLIIYKKLRDNELEQIKNSPIVFDDRLAGLRFTITGQFIETSRDDIIKSITEHGGRYTRSISGKTNYLIVGKQIDERSITKDHSKTELRAQEMIDNGSPLEIINLEEYKQLIS